MNQVQIQDSDKEQGSTPIKIRIWASHKGWGVQIASIEWRFAAVELAVPAMAYLDTGFDSQQLFEYCVFRADASAVSCLRRDCSFCTPLNNHHQNMTPWKFFFF